MNFIAGIINYIHYIGLARNVDLQFLHARLAPAQHWRRSLPGVMYGKQHYFAAGGERAPMMRAYIHKYILSKRILWRLWAKPFVITEQFAIY